MRITAGTFTFIFITTIFGILFVRPAQGYAQETVPTQTPSVEITESLVSTQNAEGTETAGPAQSEAGTPFVEDRGTTRILIKVSRNARLANVVSRMTEHGQVIENEELGKLGIFILEIPADHVDEKVSELQNASGVGWVEPDYPVQSLENIPNDPSFSNQYALIAVRAPQGWDIATGSTAVTIAILDSGVDLSHPDLAGKILPGYDFVNNDSNVQDDYGHGTHVAGIAAATANNGIGIAGISWGAKIMPVKVLNSTGSGNFSDVASGVIWATDHGAQIINMSLGSTKFSQTLEDALTYAAGHGVFMAAAGGNSNANIVLYPASSPQVMAVAATDAGNQRASFSNYGPEIEIAAPGDSILSLWPGGSYNTISGTSMATPCISGLAAILLGYEDNANVVREYLKQSALDIAPAGFDIYTGAGLIQMDAALQLVLPSATATIVDQDRAAGFSPPFSNPVSTWAPTPLTPVTAVSTISTTPTLVFNTPSFTASPRDEYEYTDAPEVEALAQSRDFGSPLFCTGIVFVLFGLIILYIYRKRSS